MSCIATGPINLLHTDNRCFNKCKFNYDFKKTEVIAKNKLTYISIKVANKDTIIGEYSSTNTPLCKNGQGSSKLVVDEIRLYAPSLHNYGKEQTIADGELFIILRNVSGGRNLIICLPVSTLNGTLPAAKSNLIDIIKYLSNAGNSTNEGGEVKGLNFNLNNFIPKNGYYSYTGSLPWSPCDKCNDIIIYDINDAVIGLPNEIMSLLTKLIKPSPNIKIANTSHDKIGYAYNKKGALKGMGSGDDKIWINCYPTGSSGEILMEENKSGIINNNSFAMISGMKQSKYERIKMILFTVISTIIAVLALIFIVNYLMKVILGKEIKLPNLGKKPPE